MADYKQSQYYIGLMSGTSIDSLDGCICDFNGGYKLVSTASYTWRKDEAELLHSLCTPSYNELEKAGEASNLIAKASSKVVSSLLDKANLKSTDIIAIGSHGQTVRHCPQKGFSIQLDNPALTAFLTNIDVVSNFRACDLAQGGEGAPLTPIFHKKLFSSKERCRFVLNLGGISNLTVLDTNGEIICGFDCGPANTLIDLVARSLINEKCDKDAKHAFLGKVRLEWLEDLLSHPYLKLDPPKSTGRETFNQDFIREYLLLCSAYPQYTNDLFATLSEYSVLCVVNALRKIMYKNSYLDGELILCGGGARNPYFIKRFNELLKPCNIEVMTMNDLGIEEDYLEAMSFAYFAKTSIENEKLDLRRVTGACDLEIIGSISKANYGYHFRTSKVL